MRHWDVLCHWIPQTPTVGAEVGVLRGENALNLLMRRPNLQLHLIENWSLDGMHGMTEDPLEVREQAVRTLLPFASRCWWHEVHMKDAASRFADKSLDFVFLDADHEEDSTFKAITLYHPKVKLWLGGHDYGHPWFPGVARAVDRYTLEHGYNLTLAQDGCWFIPPQ